MKGLLWPINLALAVALGMLALWVQDRRPENHYPEVPAFSPEALDVPPPGDDRSDTRGALVAVKLSGNGPEQLWRKTLFRPDRTEEADAQGDSGESKVVPEEDVGLELIGIGRIGKREAAVILVKQQNRRGRRTGGTQSDQGSRHVYRVGQEIEDTGYTLVRIGLGEVELRAGEITRIIELNPGDEASSKRASMAVAHHRAKERRQANKETQTDAEKPPSPPPPPPIPTPSSDTDADENDTAENRELSKRERIRRALEARRRLLEQRRKQLQKENGS